MTRRTVILFTAAALAALAQQPAAEPDADTTPLFRTSVSLIKVDAKVTTRDGRDVGDLNGTDFLVYDENELRKLAYFGRESDPIDLLLVLDVSASMRKSLAQLSEKASEALRQLRPGDQVGVLLFATRSELVQPLTTETNVVPAKITNSIYKGTLGQTTLVNEALLEAARHLRTQRQGARRSIVLVSDNEGARQAISDEQVIRELHAADAVLNAILVGAADPKPRAAARYQNPASAPPDVFRYASATGGDVLTGEEPSGALQRIVQRATTRHTLQYAAPAGGVPGSFRRIHVDLAPAVKRRYPDAVVQARSGYDVAM